MKSTNLKQYHSLLITHCLLILHSLLTLISIEEDFHHFIKIKDPLDSPFHQDHQQGAFTVHNLILHSPWEPQESELLLTNEAIKILPLPFFLRFDWVKGVRYDLNDEFLSQPTCYNFINRKSHICILD